MDNIIHGVSVVICTYNGSKRLPDTVDHLLKQQLPAGLSWEIILVDNASTDHTLQVANALAASSQQVQFSVIQEPRAGKSYALDTGILAARYRYVIICDDDNWLDESYVSTAYSLMQATPQAGALGGVGNPVFGSAPPPWFEKYAPDYAVGPQHTSNGDITGAKGWVVGAGMVLNKPAWMRVRAAGYTGGLTCRKGDSLSAGGDVEMCYLLRLFGYSIVYSSQLRFEHFLPGQRLNWHYLSRMYEGSAQGDIYLQCYKYFFAAPDGYLNSSRQIYYKVLKKSFVFVKRNWRQVWKVIRQGVRENNYESLMMQYAYTRLKTALSERRAVLHHIDQLRNLVANRDKEEQERRETEPATGYLSGAGPTG